MINNFNNTNFNRFKQQGEQNNENNFSVLQKARKDLVGEINAIIEYDDHIHSSINQAANETWRKIKNEELNHVGELLALIDYLDSSQKEYVLEGINEFNEQINRR